jgi:hypothetical protein
VAPGSFTGNKNKDNKNRNPPHENHRHLKHNQSKNLINYNNANKNNKVRKEQKLTSKEIMILDTHLRPVRMLAMGASVTSLLLSCACFSSTTSSCIR